MKIANSVLLLFLAASLASCGGSSQPLGDKTACHDYRQWESVGGPGPNFGSFTNLIDAAVRSASAVPDSEAKAIADGLPESRAHDPAARLLWDLSNVQGDAEGDISPPIGWSEEVDQVKLDCEDHL